MRGGPGGGHMLISGDDFLFVGANPGAGLTGGEYQGRRQPSEEHGQKVELTSGSVPLSLSFLFGNFAKWSDFLSSFIFHIKIFISKKKLDPERWSIAGSGSSTERRKAGYP